MKLTDNFKIITKSGNEYDMLSDFGVMVKSFIISSPSPVIQTDTIENVDGAFRLGKTFGERSLKATCFFVAVDTYDMALLRNELFKVLMQKEEFYLITDVEPGKRWLVEVSNEWEASKNAVLGEFSLEFVSHKPYAESVGTTKDPFTFDSGLWQMGQGLIDEDLIYTHSTNSFSIYNAGDIKIDPRWLPLIISYKGASTNLKIKNTTTGEEWSYIGTTNPEDVINLDGIRSTKNGLSITRSTNKKLLTLAPGWNNFILTGTSGSFEIIFDFRFYYL